MTDLDGNAGRDFKGLDAREAQEALAEEIGAEIEEEELADEDEEMEVEAAVEPVSEEDLAEHARMAEALLFAASEPLDVKSIADRLPAGADIPAVLEGLAERYEGRGVNLRKIDNRWRFVTAPDVAPVLQKEKVKQRRLSRAALETLAIIAYHQPCTRADIEDVRGVAVSKGSLDQLLEIGWAKLRGKRRDVPGQPILYGTTQAFLEHFGLESVGDLPGLADLKAAGLLDARLPPGFSVPNPTDSGEEPEDEEDDEAEFAQDFLEEEGEETADA